MGQGSRGTEGKGSWAGNPGLGKGGAGTRGESGGIRPQPLVKSHLWAVLPSSVLIKGRSGLHTATSSGQFSSFYY